MLAGLGLPYPVAILAALVAMLLLGVLFHFVVIQWTLPHGFFHTMLVTVAFGNLMSQLALLTFGFKTSVGGAVLPGRILRRRHKLSPGKLLVILGAIVVMAALYFFMKTRTGTAMLAAAENREVAGLQGINAKRIFWITMAVGCGLCGVAGAFIVPVLSAIQPHGHQRLCHGRCSWSS